MRNVVITPKWLLFRFLAIFFGLFWGAGNLGYAYFLGQLVDVAYAHDLYLLRVWIGAAVGLYVFSELIYVGYNFAIAALLPGYQHKTRGLILVHWFKIVPKRKMREGALANALMDDIDTIISSEESATFRLSYASATAVGTAGLLFWMHWAIGIAAVGVLFFNLLLLVFVFSSVQAMNQRLSQVRAKYYGGSQEVDNNRLQYETMRLLGRYQGSIRKCLSIYKAENIPISLKLVTLLRTNAALVSITMLCPIAVAAIFRTELGISYGGITLITVLANRLAVVATLLAQSFFSLMGIKPLKAKYVPKTVEKAVGLSYSAFVPVFDGEEAVKKVSLDLSDNKKVFFSGANGSGKSTALSVLDKEFAFNGSVTVKGEQTSGTDLDRYAVCRPSSDSCVFGGVSELEKVFETGQNSLFNNTLEIVASHKIVLEGEREGKSQGETQLLSLLHALATKPSLLILDESLSSVAADLRKEIYQVLVAEKDLTLAVVDHTLESEGRSLFNEVVTFSK